MRKVITLRVVVDPLGCDDATVKHVLENALPEWLHAPRRDPRYVERGTGYTVVLEEVNVIDLVDRP